MKTGGIIEVRWLRHGETVPTGWRVVQSDPAVLRHHGQHCVMIERTVPERSRLTGPGTKPLATA